MLLLYSAEKEHQLPEPYTGNVQSLGFVPVPFCTRTPESEYEYYYSDDEEGAGEE